MITIPVRSRRLRRLLIGLALVLAVVALAPLAFSALGGWLIVADPLEHATAIVVLSGGMPFRALEGAVLYRDGWAPEVWLTRGRRAASDDALDQLGVARIGEYEYNREVLVRSGVPPTAIRLLEGWAVDTVDEVKAVAVELRRRDATRAIIVTSRFHTRRVRSTWGAVVGATPDAIVRPTTDDPSDPDRWWRTSTDALLVAREVFGLLNVWAGFPLPPRR